MSFDFSTLVTDRTQADVNRVKQIAEKIKNGTASESELAEFNSAAMKGAYNYTDLNRVTAAMEALKAKLEGYGYAVPGYQRIEIEHPSVSKKLPDGYIELTYIESTGKQYINTGLINTTGYVIETKMNFTSLGSSASSNSAYICGSYNSSARSYVLLYNSKFGIGVSTDTFASDTVSIGTDYVIKASVLSGDGYLIVDGVQKATNKSAYDLSANNLDFRLFTIDSTTTHYARMCSAKMYYFKIWDSAGRLVRDFVPCVNPNGEVGLYDTVTKSFFGNSGTGAFVSGARVGITLPEEYTRVEYIESTGTQYINTGISVPHASCKIAVKFKTRNILDRPPITGYAYPTWNWSVNMMFPYQNVFYANGTSTGIAFAANTLYNAEYTNSYVTVNGTTVQKSIANTVDGYNNTIFYGSTRYGAHLLYEYRLYNDGTLVRDMIPVIRKQDGEAGLYDLVNGVFYGNAGTGTFATGDIIPQPTDVPDPYTWYEYDWPTPETMTVYLLNVSAIRAVLAVMKSTPSVPVDMVGLMVQEANDIETILLNVYRQLTIMPTTFIPCGEALCGGDNL